MIEYRSMRPAIHFALFCLGVVGPETQTSVAERDCISRYSVNKKRAAEIGVWHGVTTCRIAESLTPDGLVYAVDNYAVGRLGISFQYAVARRNTSKWRNKIQFVRHTGQQAAALLKERFQPALDLIFIDGDHSYEGLRADWEAWTPLLGCDGVVALHDSCSSTTRNLEDAGSCIFTREVILRDDRFELLEEVDTLSVLRCKRSD